MIKAFGNLKKKLEAGDICFGMTITLADPCVTEIICSSGYDFIMLDAEHGPHDRQTLQSHMIAAAITETTPIVRVTANRPDFIKQALDGGAAGVIVPLVKNADDVRRAVDACLYPTAGTRGFGPRRASGYGRNTVGYRENANDEVNVWIMLEQIEAVENIDEILAVPGLTGFYIGRSDLSGSFGILGQIEDPQVIKAVETVAAKGRDAGVAVGMAGPFDPDTLPHWIEKGVQFFSLGGDTALLLQSSDDIIKKAREIAEKSKGQKVKKSKG